MFYSSVWMFREKKPKSSINSRCLGGGACERMCAWKEDNTLKKA